VKLELTYELVHGTDRGGEDVSLGVKLTADELPSTEADLRAAAGAAFDEWLAETVNGGDEVYVEDGCVRTSECEYGFSVNRPLEEVRRDVVETAVRGVQPAVVDKWGEESHAEWFRRVGSGTYVLRDEFYRDGNAD